MFPHLGKLYHEKSGNPEADPKKVFEEKMDDKKLDFAACQIFLRLFPK
jgi:hypothetical protein